MAFEYLASGATSLAAAFWLLADGTAGSGPAANATLIIPDGVQAITTAVDQSAAGGMRSFEVNRLFTGTIGSLGTPAKLYLTDSTAAEKTSANSESFIRYDAGGGAFYISCSTVSGTSSIDNFFQNSVGAVYFVTGLCVFYHLTNGPLTVKANGTLTNFDAWGGSSTIDSGGTNLTNMTIFGGNHIVNRAVTGTLTIYGGSVTLNYEGTTATGTVNLRGGTFDHRAGDVTTMNHDAGLHDYSNMRRKSTITTCTRKPNAVSRGIRSSGMLTVTTDTTIGFPQFAA